MSYAVDIAFGASVMVVALLASGHALIYKREARSAVNDFLGGSGTFPPNTAIAEGDYWGASLRLARSAGCS